MAVAVVQKIASAEITSATLAAVTFGSNTTAGNRVVACTALFDSDGVAPTGFTVTDSQTNAYSLAREQAFGGDAGNDGSRLGQHYSAAIVGGASHEVTVTPGDTVAITVGIFELSGVHASSPVAGSGGGIGSSTAPSTGSVSPTGNGLFLAHMGYDSGAKIITPNWTSATEELEIDENNTAQDQSILSKAAANGVADTAAWTLNSTAPWGAQMVNYQEAAAGGGGGSKKRPGIKVGGMMGNGTLLAA